MLFAPMMFGGEGLVALALIISLSILVPINLATYPRNWIDADEHCGKKFTLCMLPYLILLVVGIFRTDFPMYDWIGSENSGAYIINLESKNNIFATLSLDSGMSIMKIAAMISIAAASLSIYFITQSRFIVRNILAVCGAGVAIFAIFGFISILAGKISTGSSQGFFGENAFSTFSDASSWSYIAMIWTSALMGSAIYTFQRFKLLRIFFSIRGLSICIAMIIALSAIYTAPEKHKILIYAQLAIFFAVYAFNVLPTAESLKRHLNPELKKIQKYSKTLTFAPFAIYSALTLLFIFNATSTFLDYKNNAHSPEALKAQAYYSSIASDTYSLIAERPILGWGQESFSNAMAFKQGDDIESTPIESPDSDFFKFLAENGYIGFILVAIVPFLFGIRFLTEFKISQSGIIFLTTIISTLLLAFYSTPFQTTAVLFSFWILLFSFFTWEDAEII